MEVEMVEAEDQKFKTNLTIEETMEVEDQDRISLLPDCLLIVILSLLDSTNEAIKTSTLSKRWQYLWTYVPNLIFSDFIHDDDHLTFDFYSFVDKTLTQCRLSNLNIFRIRTRFDMQFESQVNSWIRYAVNRNVQDFHLALGNINHSMVFEFELNSNFFFKNSSFTKLTLAGCSFNPTGVISFTDAMVLGGLILLLSRGGKWVGLGWFGSWVKWVMGPMGQTGDLLLKNILLLNVSSLVQAHLDYLFGEGEYDHTPCDEEEEEFFKGLILGLHHVKEITIGTLCSKACQSSNVVVDPTPHFIDWSEYDIDSDESCDSEELLAFM
ncbi:F-box protein-like protein [Tanacetum coccineum]